MRDSKLKDIYSLKLYIVLSVGVDITYVCVHGALNHVLGSPVLMSFDIYLIFLR